MLEEFTHGDAGDDPELREKLRTTALLIEERASKLGLYLDAMQIAQDGNDQNRIMFFTSFSVGDLAFQPKTVDPEEAKMNRQFLEITDSLEEDQIAQRRKEAKERYQALQEDDE